MKTYLLATLTFAALCGSAFANTQPIVFDHAMVTAVTSATPDMPAVIVNEPSAYVNAGGVFKWFVDWIWPAFSVLIMGAVGYLVKLLRSRAHVQLTDASVKILTSYALSAAGRILAALEPKMMNLAINVGSPLVAAQVQHVLDHLPNFVVNTLKLDPNKVARAIAGQIGVLQSTGTNGQSSDVVNVEAPAASVVNVSGENKDELPEVRLGGH